MTVSQGTYLKAVVSWDLPLSVIAQSVFYYQLKGLSPVSDATILSALVTGLEDMFDNLNSYWSTQVSLNTVTVNEWEYDTTDQWHTGRYIGEGALTDGFASGTDMLPHASAAVITGNTGNVNVKSRKSLPGVIDTQAVDSQVQASTLTALANFAVDWIAQMFVDTNEYLEPGVPGKEGIWYALASALVSDLIGSQRRRKPGIGV